MQDLSTGGYTATAGASSVTVAVSAGPAAPSAPASGYDVKRGGTHVCYINGASGNCPETGLGAGTFTYDVFSVIGSGLGGATPSISWTSATSVQKSATIVSAAAPNIPGTPDLTNGSDSNINNDNITNVNTPTFTGSIVGQPNQTVHIFVDGVDKGTGSGTGSTYTVPTSALTDGLHNIQAKATLDGTTFSNNNGSLNVTIDTQGPTVGAPTVGNNGDNNNGKALSGTAGHATNDILTVNVTASGNASCSISAPGTANVNSSTGAWSGLTVSMNRGVSCTVTISQSDVAGNPGSGSATATRG